MCCTCRMYRLPSVIPPVFLPAINKAFSTHYDLIGNTTDV